MKTKIILLLAGLLLMSGCSQNSADLQTILTKSMEAMSMETMNSTLDMNKNLYSYYLEPGIGRRESNETSTVLLKEGLSFIMNLDISLILIEQYYQDSLKKFPEKNSEEKQIAKVNGFYDDYKRISRSYELTVFQMNSKQYLVTLQTPYFNFLAHVPYGGIKPISIEMMRVARASKINKDLIIASYSLKDSIEFIKEPLDLFQQEIPESGRLDEMNDRFNPDKEWNEVEGTDPEDQRHDVYEP